MTLLSITQHGSEIPISTLIQLTTLTMVVTTTAADNDGHVVALRYCCVVLLLLLLWWSWLCVIVALLSWSHHVAWSSSTVVSCRHRPSSRRVVCRHAHSAVVHCDVAVSSHHPLEWQREGPDYRCRSLCTF
jgi:hypothetical protein